MDALERKRVVANPDTEPGKKGGSRAAKGINVNLLFIVDESGKAISGHEGTNIRRFGWSIWQSWLDDGIAPAKWSILPNNLSLSFWTDMEA